MQLLTNPWFIIFSMLTLIVLIYLAIRLYRYKKNKSTLFEELKKSSINPANEKKPSFLENLAKHGIFPTLRSKKPMFVDDRKSENKK